MVTLTCASCGRSFQRRNAEHARNLRQGRAAYCSLGCVHRKRPEEAGDSIPWLQPRNEHERWLAEMLTGAAIEYRKTFAGDDLAPGAQRTADYWSGYWAALVDYGRRVFAVRSYNGPEVSGGKKKAKSSRADDGASVPEQEMREV